MELLNNFGIEPILLVAQLVNFLIILYVLKRFAYKPLLTLLKNREETIKKGLKDAQDARAMLENAEQKERDILMKAQEQAKILLEETKKQNVEMMRKTEEETKKRTEEMMVEAKRQIQEESKSAEIRLKTYTSELALAFLTKATKELFTEREQKEAIQNAVKKMKGMK